MLIIHVIDNGRGICKTETEKLFKLFGKLEEHEVDSPVNGEGIGVGLFICKQIVDNNGGFIDCYSAGEGHGATFMFGMHMRQTSTHTATNCTNVTDQMMTIGDS